MNLILHEDAGLAAAHEQNRRLSILICMYMVSEIRPNHRHQVFSKKEARFLQQHIYKG